MKTKMIIAALALLMSSGAASAENWKTIGEEPTGGIFEIDLDTIRHNGNGSATVMVGTSGVNSTMFFDCQGHYGWSSKKVIHIPSQSIAEATEGLICQPESESRMPKTSTSAGCTNQKLDDNVPVCGDDR